MQKILLYEYFTGGGLLNEELKSDLFFEANLMRNNIEDCGRNSADIKVHSLLDHRLKKHTNSNSILVKSDKKHIDIKLLKSYDYVLPIIPETDMLLYSYVKYLEDNEINTLISDSATIKVCSDKKKLHSYLFKSNISKPKIFDSKDAINLKSKIIIKPRLGAGCEDIRIIDSTSQFEYNNKYEIMESYINGESLSLSIFFTNTSFRLLSVNKQIINIQNNKLKLTGIVVNVYSKNSPEIIYLLSRIKNMLPGLYGFVGIDIIIDKGEIFVIEINPRLTTSFCGLYHALGINLLDFIFTKHNKNIINSKQNYLKI